MINNPFARSSSPFPHVEKKIEEQSKELVVGQKTPEEASIEILDTPIAPQEDEHIRILREHNFIESDIPIRHLYWKLRP